MFFSEEFKSLEDKISYKSSADIYLLSKSEIYALLIKCWGKKKDVLF